MKRAILVSTGTIAGLAAVLTYSGGDQVTAVSASSSTGGGSVTGGPPPLPSDTPSDSATPAASAPATTAASPAAATTTAAAAPTKAAPKPAAATTAAAPAPTTAAPTPVATKPAPKPTPTPKPTPKPTQTGPKDYTGSLQTHKYGQVQVGIRVQNKKIIAVWAVVAPSGASQPYSDFSIPVLKQETMAAQGTSIANVSGATLTWQSWKTSLQSAMSQAGL
jgi:uncharacterized protein with FMN-binding domain